MTGRTEERFRTLLASRTDAVERHLTAMNHAIELTRDYGPAVAVEYIADYLNGCDGCDADLADTLPADWLTRWEVHER